MLRAKMALPLTQVCMKKIIISALAFAFSTQLLIAVDHIYIYTPEELVHLEQQQDALQKRRKKVCRILAAAPVAWGLAVGCLEIHRQHNLFWLRRPATDYRLTWSGWAVGWFLQRYAEQWAQDENLLEKDKSFSYHLPYFIGYWLSGPLNQLLNERSSYYY